jgi:hypothetical protein
MFSETLLPSESLSPFVSGYYIVTVENQEGEISICPFQSGVSIGVPLGKPFHFYAGKNHGEFEEVSFSPFDKPMIFWDSKSLECFSVKGNARIVFIAFTPSGLEVLLGEKNVFYSEMIFPLGSLGIPIFNLATKRKIRFNQDNESAIKLIECELLRFFHKQIVSDPLTKEFSLGTNFRVIS